MRVVLLANVGTVMIPELLDILEVIPESGASYAVDTKELGTRRFAFKMSQYLRSIG